MCHQGRKKHGFRSDQNIVVLLLFFFLDIDDCSPNPCQNNGICMDQTNSYVCFCLNDYTGTNCQTGKFHFCFFFFMPQHPSPNTHHPSPNTHHPSPNTHHPTPITHLSIDHFCHHLSHLSGLRIFPNLWIFYKSPFASKCLWKKRSSHQGKKEVACIVSKPLVSCLWGCGELVVLQNETSRRFRGLCPLDQRETQARYSLITPLIDEFMGVKGELEPPFARSSWSKEGVISRMDKFVLLLMWSISLLSSQTLVPVETTLASMASVCLVRISTIVCVRRRGQDGTVTRFLINKSVPAIPARMAAPAWSCLADITVCVWVDLPGCIVNLTSTNASINSYVKMAEPVWTPLGHTSKSVYTSGPKVTLQRCIEPNATKPMFK